MSAELRARWCVTKGWPLMAHFARCPYCGLFVEPKLHPDWEYSDPPEDLVEQDEAERPRPKRGVGHRRADRPRL